MTSFPLLRLALTVGALAVLIPGGGSRRLGAQSAVHGALAGTIVDAAGRPIHDAEVRITDHASAAARVLVTGRDGAFRFGLLTPGTYDMAVEALGYRPMRYVGVRVVAGTTPVVRIALRADTPPVVRVDTVQAPGARSAPLLWLVERGYAELVGGRSLATDAALLSVGADEQSVEGLPWRHADLMIDGARLAALAAPGDAGTTTTALALPLRALSEVSVGGIGYDVEAGGSGVGLNALSLRGGGDTFVHGTMFGGTSDIGAAVTFGGPIQRDTAHAIVGLDYRRSQIARPAWFPADDAAGRLLVDIARDSFATDLGAHALETPRTEERASGFGRLDWQMGDRYSISMRAAGSHLVVASPPLLTGHATGLGSSYESSGAQLSVDLLARINARLSAEVRLSGDVAEITSDRPSLPPTSFAGRGVTLGGAATEPFRDQLAVPRLSAIAHWALGAHRVKLGGAFSTSRQETQGVAGTFGGFAFGDAGDFSAGRGAWRGLEGNASSGNFALSEAAFFVQDAWAVTEGFSVIAGARLDRQGLSAGDLELNADWKAQTGLDNTAVRSNRTRLAPRIGFRWQLGDARQWMLEGGAGVYNGLPDRRDMGEAFALDRGVGVRSAVGALGSWPAAPDVAVAPLRGQTLALLGPGLEGPRTRRFGLSVLREIGSWNAYVKGVYRQTDFLARRRDLNLPLTVGSDQHGRPLQGVLQQVGTLVAAVPGSNRRFAGFDAVTAIEVTGFSEFWAATAGVERVLDPGLSLALHYTFSHTLDNLAAGQHALAPTTLGLDGSDWNEGRADVDVPHRFVAAAEWSMPPGGAYRVGAVFRLRSGTPFTPGFRDGVDANGDGVAGNDPAFVDATIPGTDALLAAHDCLQRSVGTFAERNGCRGDWIYRLDLRATIRIATFSAGPVDLVADALDVLGGIVGSSGGVDRALYLVDGAGTLTTNALTGVTSVPLVANANFGAPLADRSPGVLFRVGLRIGR